MGTKARAFSNAASSARPPAGGASRPSRRTDALRAALTVLSVGSIAAFALGVRPVLAADPVVTAIRVEGPTRATVGDHLKLVLTIEAASGTVVSLAPGTVPDEITVVKAPEVKSKDRGSGRVEITFTAEFAPFFVGDYTLRPLKLRFRDTDGLTGEFQTPPVKMTVISTLPGNTRVDPRPLKPQAAFESTTTPAWILGLLAGLVAALILTLVLLYWRQRTGSLAAEIETEVAAEPLGPEDQARVDLDLAVTKHLAAGDLPAYYAVLSSTVRGYLTDRFGFPAFALTTAELQSQMVFRGMDRWQARLVGGLLEQCDAVVFALYRPAAERAELDLTAAYEIVEMSRPGEVEMEEVAP